MHCKSFLVTIPHARELGIIGVCLLDVRNVAGNPLYGRYVVGWEIPLYSDRKNDRP